MNHKRRPRIAPGWRFASGTGGGVARGFLRFWLLWEWLTVRHPERDLIPGAPHGLLRIVPARYHGRPITLPDGTQVTRGMRVGEMHLYNPALARYRDLSALELIALLKDELRALARWLASDPQMADIAAIWGVTILSRAMPRLGFTTRDRSVTPHAYLERFFMRGLLAVYNPQGIGRLLRGSARNQFPQEIWLSRKALFAMYGGGQGA